MTEESTIPAAAQPRWQPVGAIDRRVLGVLAEKAKTTPDSYPMSLNAICVGCNQKSSRFPVMQLEPEDCETALERLRSIGAVGLIEGSGRVQKYRHYLYEWLGVDKVELAVMTELLLRGAQTLGELRGRAARMEPIADLEALRPIVDSLKAKGLVISLTPEGRGQVVAHNLYPPRELEKVKTQFAASGAESLSAVEDVSSPLERAVNTPHRMQAADASHDAVAELRTALDSMGSTIDSLRAEIQELTNRCQKTERELDDLRTSLGG